MGLEDKCKFYNPALLAFYPTEFYNPALAASQPHNFCNPNDPELNFPKSKSAGL